MKTFANKSNLKSSNHLLLKRAFQNSRRTVSGNPAKYPKPKAAPKENADKPKPPSRSRSAAPKKPFNRTAASKPKRNR